MACIRRGLARRHGAALAVGLVIGLAACGAGPAWSQAGSSKEQALAIISAWQGSSRAPTPEARAQKIEEALALAVAANPWPLREPGRDKLLGQMWGQLGNEYRRIEGANRPEALERALKAYQQALGHTAAERGQDWARVQFGLAMVHLDRVRGDRAQNIEAAIAALNATAEVMTREAAASYWASISINLSKAYWHRIEGRRADNLERAIEAAEAALAVLSREKAPDTWAAAQQALGASLWARIRGVRADNVEKAIAAYEQALAVASLEKSAKAWAGIHDNLGMAYAERGRGNARENLQRSAAHFENAARVFTREAYPSEWAQLNMNFANLLLDAELDSPAERIERAIARYTAALTVYTPQAYPERSARVKLNLGIAYARRIKGNAADNVEQAIAAYESALGHYTRASDPSKWAVAQNNLAGALRQRAGGDRAANLAAAAAAAEAALSVNTLAAAPLLHLRSAQNAGQIALARRDWAGARAQFASAIAASNVLFAGGLNRAEAESVVREGSTLFPSAAYAAVMLGAPKEALHILESGKARMLRVSLGLDALVLPREQRQRLERTREQIRAIEARVDLVGGEERLQAVREIEALRKQAEGIVAQAQPAAQDAAEGTLKEAGSLLARHGALVLPVVSEQGAALLTVTPDAGRGVAVAASAIDGLDSAALARFVLGADPSGRVAGWLGAYAVNSLPADQQGALRANWLQAIASLPADLERLAGAAIAQSLRANGVAREAAVLWVPHGALGLLPIGIAGDGQGTGGLIDGYTITTAPSLVAARIAAERAAAAGTARLAAVVNPTGDLQFTEPEGSVSGSYFAAGRRTVLGAETANLKAVLDALSKANHWHFATHGGFSWANPTQSALQLAGGQRLTIGELLDRGDLGHPRLVVLSACETGVFEFQRAPDEFTGLPAAFLQAGAAGVIGSLWPVDDIATALIMMKFYDLYIGQRMAPAPALRRSQLWVRDATPERLRDLVTGMQKSKRLSAADGARLIAQLASPGGGQKPFAHPYYWAAFQYYGN
ncbi:MAG: CHAT domain-containing protein [Hyphomicrobiaceae bacterium]|nr:CHAT domain-containing protein [Hyphomicrobiaceae bacterium]